MPRMPEQNNNLIPGGHGLINSYVNRGITSSKLNILEDDLREDLIPKDVLILPQISELNTNSYFYVYDTANKILNRIGAEDLHIKFLSDISQKIKEKRPLTYQIKANKEELFDNIDTAMPDTLYLVPHKLNINELDEKYNYYDEYLFIKETKTFERLGTDKVDLSKYLTRAEVLSEISQAISSLESNLNNKITLHEKAQNPHKITKEIIGLANVNNTSDEEKPISNKTQSALNKKAEKEDLSSLEAKLYHQLSLKAEKANSVSSNDVYFKQEIDNKDNALRITLGELEKIKANKATTLEGYGIIDKYYNQEQIDRALLAKADKGNKLADYNISDAYTKEAIDYKLLNNTIKYRNFDSITEFNQFYKSIDIGSLCTFSDDSGIDNLDSYKSTDIIIHDKDGTKIVRGKTEDFISPVSLNPTSSKAIYKALVKKQDDLNSVTGSETVNTYLHKNKYTGELEWIRSSLDDDANPGVKIIAVSTIENLKSTIFKLELSDGSFLNLEYSKEPIAMLEAGDTEEELTLVLENALVGGSAQIKIEK